MKNRSRYKKAIFVLLSSLILLIINSISYSEDFLPAYRNSRNITLKVLSWFLEPKSVLKSFEKRYKNIKIEWIQIDYKNYYSQLDNLIQNLDKCPDLVFAELPLLNYYANQKLLMNLSKMGADLYQKELLEEWLWNASGRVEIVPIISGPDCYSCAKIPTEPKTQVYGLPYILGPAVLTYNEKFLKENNLNVPKSWKDFVEISKILSESNSDKKLLAIPVDPSFLIGFSWANGVKILSYSKNKYYFNFDVEPLRNLFEYIQNFYSQNNVKFLEFYQMIERPEKFIFMITPQWLVQYLNDFKCTTVPLFKNNSKVFDLNTVALSIPKNSSNPVEAFLLAGWLSCSKESSSYLRKLGLISPVNYTSTRLKNLNLKTLDGPDTSFLYPDILKEYFHEVLSEAISTSKIEYVPQLLQKRLREFFDNNKYLLLSPSKGGDCK